MITNHKVDIQSIGGTEQSGANVIDSTNAAVRVNTVASSGVAPFGAIGTGRTTVTTAGTPVLLNASQACKRVTIGAETDNTGVISVGDSNVDAATAAERGVILFAGSSVTLEVSNLNLLYIDSTVNGDGVSYLFLNST